MYAVSGRGMRARWLGRVPYDEAWDLQRALATCTQEDYLLLVEHEAIYTLGSHADPANVLVDPSTVGARLLQVDRGGDITFHGPGQLVGYPVRTVGSGPHHGPEHVRQVEQVVIDALVALGVAPDRVGRMDEYPGVWIDPSAPGTGADGPRKVAAMGVRTARGRSTHGFALNVATDLTWFDHIVPCGIIRHPMTSLVAEGLSVTMSEAVDAILSAARGVWGPIDDVSLVTGGARDSLTSVSVPTRVPVSLLAIPGTSLERRMARAGVDPAAGVQLSARKPDWLRVKATMADEYLGLKRSLRDVGLVTVCEEAGCPNIYECWADGTATFMINGSRCTRACAFCQVDTGHPFPLNPDEPVRVAEAVARMGLAYAVITCVARDDLSDGGAGAFADTIARVRGLCPDTAIEVLISDCKGDKDSLGTILDARPDVLNHNIETVARLQRAVRPSAGYARSLTVLARSVAAGLTTKSGIMLGMGEREDEVLSTLADLRAVGVDIVTLGQYLRPSAQHLPVERWWTPSSPCCGMPAWLSDSLMYRPRPSPARVTTLVRRPTPRTAHRFPPRCP
jgi:lipoic acid synthetase